MRQPYHNPSAGRQPVSLAGARPGLRQLGATLLLALGVGLATSPARAQQSQPSATFFRPDAAARTAAAASPLAATLVRSQALTLDEPGLRAALATAPLEGRAGAAPLVLALPQPDGSSARFALCEAPIMEAPLAARYPQIKTYAGVGLDDATATVRLDLTPQGFHAQVLSGTGPGFDIDPASPTDTRHCLSYYRQHVQPAAAGKAPICGTVTTPAEEQASAARVAAWRAGGGAAAARSTGAQLRVYRLALTCTPEYALTKGNTTASVLAALVVSLNRVVGIFERELTVRLVLVANNDRLIFLSGTGPQPSPSLTNGDTSPLILENQANVDRLIGDANYDIGHVIFAGGGGRGMITGVCLRGGKAQAASADDVEVIGHEMGHQLGASHSFNAERGREQNKAWEPGSGTTLMSYAGSFGPLYDVQSYSDYIFHTGSYEEMQTTLSGKSCGTTVATGNTPPTVTAPASGKILPAGTPFRLTATATDAENDPLTYSWEELDTGPAGDLTQPQVAGETPPLFRTRPPVVSPTRYFPRLDELVNNTVAPGERLPTVTRGLKFRCTARDLHNGTAGPVGGISYSALVTLDVSAAAGPFLVTAPNAAGISWAGGSTQTVSWNVANTNTAPVSCAKVNLRLSLDGGLTYPTVLASNVNNSGTASITVPNVANTTATARVMVEAADNYFFDISNNNFTITPTVLPPAAGVLVTGIVPASAITGARIRLTGTGLSGATRVSFTSSGNNGNNTVSSGFTVNAAGTELSGLVVPVGAVTGALTVTTPAGTSAASSQVFTVCAKPAALAQNTRLVLNAAGTGTLAPTAVNSGSNANCGVAAASTLSVVPNTFTTADIGPPVVASALSFNGNNQYVAIGGSATMPSDDSPYTIEAWVKPTTMGSYGIIGWGGFGIPYACNALRLSETGLVNYWWGKDLEAPTPNLVGAWHHVAATCDGTTRTLYLDGVAIGSDQPGTHRVPAANNLRIGSTNSGEYFNGSIDEVRVWNVSRTAAQLKTARGANLLGNPAGLVAYYRFGEGSGPTTTDANGVTVNAGTLSGGASWSTDAPAIVNGVPVVLTVTDESGQTGTAPAVVTVVAGTLATTAATATAFSVWPNPVGAKSTLHVRLAVPASGAHVSLRNGLGQLVSTRSFSGSTTELSTAGLASGLYLLSVQADDQAPAVRRVMVE